MKNQYAIKTNADFDAINKICNTVTIVDDGYWSKIYGSRMELSVLFDKLKRQGWLEQWLVLTERQ